MSLVVSTNMMALNTHRNLKGINYSIGKTSARLSGGLRINTAADDAAGLAISEKMRAQIRSLFKAERNTLDGISLIQTAEGGMNEIQEMLRRQRELIIQALNDTNADGDKDKIQLEINQLSAEISDTAYKTEFNGIKVLLGSSGSARNYKELPPYVYSKDYPFTGSGFSIPFSGHWDIPPQIVNIPGNDLTKIAYIDFEYFDYWYESGTVHHTHAVMFMMDIMDFNGNDDDVYIIMTDESGKEVRISVAEATPGTIDTGNNTYELRIIR
jgi:flagellin-like hook-associated protein FlgL